MDLSVEGPCAGEPRLAMRFALPIERHSQPECCMRQISEHKDRRSDDWGV